MVNLEEIFGENVFSILVMRERLPKDVYREIRGILEHGGELSVMSANVVAEAMKDWALERGATHFSHWFQPLTGITAQKHDAFVSHPDEDGRMLTEFSGKELIKGEPDASSFPSGGLRATFEARGYTAWDPTSYAFIKGKTLCIPTAFCAYGGEALDQKTPLLRSMEAINRQAMRVLKLFGNADVRHITTSVGPEQEYFLIDRKVYEKRRDLIYTGRTLFGAKPPKGQELDDHYFGAIKPRVQAFMDELNEELWKLGIYAKTEHNEVAPSQHELAAIYTTTNKAVDQNQLTMEIMQRIASRHGLVCLLHEKPFAGVNGSGKHNNWSISTDTGVNLLSPGETPYENAQFLLFLVAVVQAVDDYQELLRTSVATAGNDHRLGGNEAPPAVVSIFLGDELTAILEAIETDRPYSGTEKTVVKLGVHALPRFPRDISDRNRTSPLAFTGNKFEFRMVGSSQSIATVNTVLNTAVAESLRQYADELEGAEDFNAALHTLIQRAIAAHKRIIFNGNGYDEAWIREATKVRGLAELRTTPDCIPYLVKEKSVSLFTSHGVFTAEELRSRYEIMLQNYSNTILIEAETMAEMARCEILPAVESFAADTAAAAREKRRLIESLPCRYETKLVERLSALTDSIAGKLEALDSVMLAVRETGESVNEAFTIRDIVLPRMAELRAACDEAETLTARSYWPFPTYGDLLFSVPL